MSASMPLPTSKTDIYCESGPGTGPGAALDPLGMRFPSCPSDTFARAAVSAAPYPLGPEPSSPTVALPDEEPGAGAVLLSIESSDGRRSSTTLEPFASLVLGTGVGADVRLTDPTVSQRHCRLIHTGSWIEAVDLGSKNGISVAGARVPRAQLCVGSQLDLGRTQVRLEAPPGTAEERPSPLAGVIGDSDPMRRVAAAVRRMARLRLPVLVRGETGTGKDLVARAVHDESRRARGPFVVLNAAAISRELAESELFGHRRGAFTGAVRERKGAFREADGGTLFLDEIASLPLALQAKLLRAVEEGAVRPLGGESSVPVDVRLVAATCEPLEAMVALRQFRGDLYERLAVCVLQVPPLRARTEDLASLAKHLLCASELGGRELSRGALSVLRGHAWPGNVRELRNVLVQAALRSGGRIEARDIDAILGERVHASRRRLTPSDALRVFEDVGGNVSAAARRAELPRSTMRDLLRAATAVGAGP